MTLTANNANAFASTFFLPTRKATQKNKKSLQSVSRGHCKLAKKLLQTDRSRTDYKGYMQLCFHWKFKHLHCLNFSVVG